MSENCYRKVRDWAKDKGYDIPDPLLKMMGDLLKRVQEQTGDFGPKEFRQAVDELLGQYGEHQAAKVKAQAKNDLTKELGVLETIATSPLDREETVKYVFAGGSDKPFLGSNIDPNRLKRGYTSKYLLMIKNGLSEEDRALLNGGSLAREIYQELDAIQKKMPAVSPGSPQARIANFIDTLNAAMFKDKKSVNAFMELTDDYFMHRVWKREKVMATPIKDWVEFVFNNYGEKSFPDLDAVEKVRVLESMYKSIVAGDHDTFQVGRSGGEGKLRGMAASRTLIANNWEAEFNTFERFGHDSVGEALRIGIQSTARDVAYMSKFTASPLEFGRKIISKTFRDDPAKARAMFDWYEDFLKGLTKNNTPSNALGKVTSTVLTSEVVSHLGTAAVSSWADLAVAGSLVKSATGQSLGGTTTEILGQYFKMIPNPEIRTEVALSLGLATKHALGIMNDALGVAHGSATLGEIKQMAKNGQYLDAVHSGMGKIGQLYNKVNLLDTHVEGMQGATAFVLSDGLAKVSHAKYGQLDPGLQNNLLRFGFREAEWNHLLAPAVRLVEFSDGSSARLLTPDGVMKLSDDKVLSYMAEKKLWSPSDPKPSGADLDKVRTEASMAVATMMNDFADAGSSTPGTWEHNLLYGKDDINTWWGATKRIVLQFKSAAVTNYRNVKRIAYSGADPLKADMAGLGAYAGMAITLGMVINWTKDAINGKTPQDPTDASFMAKAIASSGAGGLYADVLTSALMADNPLMGKLSVATRLMGPAAGDALDLSGLAAGYAQAGKAELMGEYKPKAPNKDMAKYLMGKTPNLPFVQQALNYYFLNGIREAIDAGSLYKMERRTNNNNALFGGQQDYFMFKPTESNR